MLEIISYCIIYLIEAIIAWQYSASIFKSKYSSKKTFAYLTLGYMMMFLLSQLGLLWINTSSFFVGNLLCIYFLYQSNFKKSIFHALILTVTMNVTELLMIYVIGWLFKDFSSITSNITLLILLAVSSKILYYLVTQLIVRLFKNNKDSSEHSGPALLLLCLIPIISLWITVTLIYIGLSGNIPNTLNWAVIVSSFLLLFLNICIFLIYTYTCESSHQHMLLQLQLQKECADAEYYKMLSEQNENQQILIHDIKKHLYSILDLINDKEMPNAKEYILQILNSNALKNKIHFCDQSTLNLILSRYRELCQKNNIQFIIDIRKNTLDFMQIEDISALFGNLLDNAIEAAAGVADAYIDLSVHKIENNQILVSMINSCLSVPLESSNGEFLSKKRAGKAHGVGMKSIKKIANKYNGSFNNYYFEKDQTFHTIITLNLL